MACTAIGMTPRRIATIESAGRSGYMLPKFNPSSQDGKRLSHYLTFDLNVLLLAFFDSSVSQHFFLCGLFGVQLSHELAAAHDQNAVGHSQ